MENINIKIEQSLTNLINWIEKNGWASYDPADIKSHPLFIFLLSKKTFFRKSVLFFLYSFCAIMPTIMRRIFRIKPTITAGGMGFLASGYIEFYKIFKNPQYLEEAREILQWLKSNRIISYENFCWGFPFNWLSTVLVPKNTPIGYTTAECTRPFIEYYKITNEKEYLEIAISACKFFNENLNKKYYKDGSLSFSYTVLDNETVINSNAIISSILKEVGLTAKINEFVNIADKIMRFVVREQLPDGSWYYFSYSYKDGPSSIDNYHTAMTLQALYKFMILERDIDKIEVYKLSLIKGLEFYINNMFKNFCLPKIYPNKVYPIDIASYAEAITLFSQILLDKNKFPLELYKKIEKTNKYLIKWVIENMQDKSGAFIFRKYRFFRIKLFSIRWGQAFMLRALTLAYRGYKLKNGSI